MNNQELTSDKTFDIVMYDIKEMQTILNTTRQTIMNYIRSGKLHAVKICGKWKVSKENLERYCRGEEQI